MKTIITSLLFLLASFANGQFPILPTGNLLPGNQIAIPTSMWQTPTLQIPAYPAIDKNATFIPPGATYTTVITNKSNHSVSLSPYLNRTGMEQIALGDSFLISYVLSQISGMTDTDEIRLKLVQLVAKKIEKTDLFNHGQIIYDPIDSSLYSKQNSIIGALVGAFQKQCSDYIRGGIAILIKTGWFNYSDLRIVNLIGHTTAEFTYRSRWAFFDYDPQEPFFMIHDSLSPTGYASALDIQADTNLISNDQRYSYVNDAGDTVDLNSPIPVSNHLYRSRFSTISTNPIPFTVAPLNIPGTIILPSQSSAIAEYKMPYILDSISFSQLLLSLTSGSPDSIYMTLSNILSVTIDSAKTIINTGNVSINYSTKTWVPDYRGITPTVKIILPNRTDTINIGKDINWGGYLLKTTTVIQFPDTSFYPNEIPNLWLPNSSQAPSLPADGTVHYLSNGGIILPRINTDTVSVSFNPMVINFGAGFKCGYMDGDSILTQIFLNDSLIASDSTYGMLWPSAKAMGMITDIGGISNVDSLTLLMRINVKKDSISSISQLSEFSIDAFPNPASSFLHIHIAGQSAPMSMMLININGEITARYEIGNETEVNVSNIDTGLYLLAILDKNMTAIDIKKIVIIH